MNHFKTPCRTQWKQKKDIISCFLSFDSADLYSGLITNTLPSNLYVKSWGKMHDSLASNCSSSIPHHVYNVKTVKLLKHDFNDTVDHSKWCVTSDESWTCVADMNRETSQMGRGGGALCMDSYEVAKAFRSTISAYEPCQTLSTASKRELWDDVKTLFCYFRFDQAVRMSKNTIEWDFIIISCWTTSCLTSTGDKAHLTLGVCAFDLLN